MHAGLRVDPFQNSRSRMGGYLGFSLDDLPQDGKEPNEQPFTGFPEVKLAL
jgi:hypothetical protein